MKKILIKNFPNLNNYGTAMMGLITIEALINNHGKDHLELFCNFDEYAIKEDIYKELNSKIKINDYTNLKDKKIEKIKNAYIRKFLIILNTIFYKEQKKFDKVIVLGGDDFSEYYSKYVASIELFKLWRVSKNTKVILLGQTLGPFKVLLNKFVFKLFLPKLEVYARDPWTVDYFKNEFRIKINQMGDIAFNQLPLQHKNDIEKEILNFYNLQKNTYITIVVSGLVNQGYYCNNEDLYLERHKEIILNIIKSNYFINKKIVLLAHTFSPYGDEHTLIEKLICRFSKIEMERIVVITEKILPTKARFILGNGLFSITGRMHPAVSTLQMGKPTIILSYSAKYQGVIGMSLNRSDLIIDANNTYLWENGTIVKLIEDKIDYVMNNYDQLQFEIQNYVQEISITNYHILSSL